MPRRKRPIYSNTYRKRRRWLLVAAVVALLAAAGLGGWLWSQRRTGVAKYAVRGVVVSQSDGNADFQALQSEGLRFVYLKGTQGASFFDDTYSTNYEQATGSGLAVGVYHFFSFDSDPAAQARYFATKVGKNLGTLPIGIQVAFYGQYAAKPPKKAVVAAKVRAFIVELQRYTTHPFILMGSKQVLGDLTEVASSAPRWQIGGHPGKQVQYWQSGTLKAAGTDYTAVAYLATTQTFKAQLTN